MFSLQAVLVQPVVVSFEATHMFLFYAGGVWLANQCQYPSKEPNAALANPNHAMLVVGFNLSTSPPYW